MNLSVRPTVCRSRAFELCSSITGVACGLVPTKASLPPAMVQWSRIGLHLRSPAKRYGRSPRTREERCGLARGEMASTHSPIQDLATLLCRMDCRATISAALSFTGLGTYGRQVSIWFFQFQATTLSLKPAEEEFVVPRSYVLPSGTEGLRFSRGRIPNALLDSRGTVWFASDRGAAFIETPSSPPEEASDAPMPIIRSVVIDDSILPVAAQIEDTCRARVRWSFHSAPIISVPSSMCC